MRNSVTPLVDIITDRAVEKAIDDFVSELFYHEPHIDAYRLRGDVEYVTREVITYFKDKVLGN